jgi:histidinol-phosphate aminotransferase
MSDVTSAPADVTSLIRPEVADMEPYAPILPYDVLSQQLGIPAGELVKLDANENPYGPSPVALRALADLDVAHIYPDPESRHLRDGLAGYVGVPPENILCGAGADELIDLIMRLFISPGDAIVNCPPTFGMYPFDAAINGARCLDVPRCPDFSLDLEAIEAAARESRAKLLIICSPNNPDGGLLPPDGLERLLALPLVVVLDEAYIEFSERPSAAGRVLSAPNLIVLRTFSKWAGLAGLRVGYGVFPAPIIAHLWKIKQPYNVNVAAQVAALASLRDVEYLRANVRKIIEERGRLAAALGDVPFLQPYPSQANFILCQVIGRDGAQLKADLAKRGVLVRYFDKPGLRDHIRVSVGRTSDTDVLLAALEELRQ